MAVVCSNLDRCSVGCSPGHGSPVDQHPGLGRCSLPPISLLYYLASLCQPTMDDFKDLAWTTASSSSASSKGKPSSQYDSFSALAATQSQRGTPNYVGSAGSSAPSRSLTPSNQTRSPAPAKAPDAFSSLLSFGSNGSNAQNLSIAERQAKVEQERRDQERKRQQAIQSQSTFWDSFEGVGSSSTAGKSVPVTGGSKSTATSLPTATLLQPTLRPSSSISNRSSTTSQPQIARITTPNAAIPVSQKQSTADVWDFDLLNASSKPKTTRPAAATAEDMLGEFDLLSAGASPTPTHKPPSRKPSPAMNGSSTPGDFDFGEDWGDGSSDNRAGLLADEEDEEDILGALGRRSGQFNTSVSVIAHQRKL